MNQKKEAKTKFPKVTGSVEKDKEIFKRGELVWAKYSQYPNWPALVVAEQTSGKIFKNDSTGEPQVHVLFLEDKDQVAWLPIKKVKLYSSPKRFLRQVQAAVTSANTLQGMNCDDRLKYYTQVQYLNLLENKKWRLTFHVLQYDCCCTLQTYI